MCEVGETYDTPRRDHRYHCDGKENVGFVYVGTSFGLEGCNRANTRPDEAPVWFARATDPVDLVQSSPAVALIHHDGKKYVYVYCAWSDGKLRGIDGIRGEIL